MNYSKNIILFLSCFFVLSLGAQTSEQARYFVNRTHIALAKVEKEMYRSNNSVPTADLKQGLKFQTIAIKMHKDGNFEKAVAYSYKAREISLDLLKTLSPNSIEGLSPDTNEKTICKPESYKELDTSNIDPTKNSEIDNLNVMDPASFHKVELNVKQQ
jgi:hypothetical protein